ncbi:MAG: hypothetical protein COB15_01750 [Flavobacteriales bacterium]|nr:MAG: hypothetical protein COB15_01750 [Flavobacteriales bacterium]
MNFVNVIARVVCAERSQSKAILLLKTIKVFSLSSFLFLFSSCGNEVSENDTENTKNDSLAVQSVVVSGEIKIIEPVFDEEVVVLENDGITLTEIKSDNNKEATIVLNTKKFSEGKNHLSFSVNGVQNYSIAYLANNYSLSQFKADVFEVEFMYGNNVFLAFLTDENNISIKTNKGSVLKSAVLGGVESLFDMNQPHLFYYLPQAETNEPILDFYLVNTAISENGNKVKVTINETEFILSKWAAYKIDGLTNEENAVRIQLIDKDDNLIEGPFNDSGERRFVIKATS